MLEFFGFNQGKALAINPMKCVQQPRWISNRAQVLQVDFGKRGQKFIRKQIGMKQQRLMLIIEDRFYFYDNKNKDYDKDQTAVIEILLILLFIQCMKDQF
ncbi:unnamed protein product [Paramecium primaurelia]|uniref:Uncharacterized protein n=1 Tax=Paramecium primaurelia TaxID=5886 RepID=A0A8S1JZN9_PARPR|nr:unnamed protein product [Paramecium primaurelia]CAD8045578.1 unnamed protein product [Paramecium primaurelia]